MIIRVFQDMIWRNYRQHKRDLPWRRTTNPYRIMVSEVMLQQTQVSRVIEKYHSFLKLFPSVRRLAAASNAQVLEAWQGLGYYRRALMLKRAAEIITKDFSGRVPRDPNQLVKLPGIGKNTAGSIAVYAYNLPVPFIETNIRKIYIHHFFHDKENISDAEIFPLIEKTLSRNHSREWFQALMDYGVHLSKTIENPNRRSKHYVKQSKFEGSLRQLRAKVLKHLIERGPSTQAQLNKALVDNRFSEALKQLQKEGFVKISNTRISLA